MNNQQMRVASPLSMNITVNVNERKKDAVPSFPMGFLRLILSGRVHGKTLNGGAPAGG
jgi:hypothetical protein